MSYVVLNGIFSHVDVVDTLLFKVMEFVDVNVIQIISGLTARHM